MTLSPLTRYPAQRSYVLKLERHATPERERIAGRLENMTSGHHFEFGTAEQLIACLVQDLGLMVQEQEDLR
ncbi:MAG: hypothetical protein K2X67_08085 [Burkholderiales bacterium]|jgi:hypothetical protein|nr:hypothetical protein [Burkholderiales bacterium]